MGNKRGGSIREERRETPPAHHGNGDHAAEKKQPHYILSVPISRAQWLAISRETGIGDILPAPLLSKVEEMRTVATLGDTAEDTTFTLSAIARCGRREFEAIQGHAETVSDDFTFRATRRRAGGAQ